MPFWRKTAICGCVADSQGASRRSPFSASCRLSHLPNQAVRRLPDLSTTVRVEPSSKGDPRLGGALPILEPAVCVTGRRWSQYHRYTMAPLTIWPPSRVHLALKSAPLRVGFESHEARAILRTRSMTDAAYRKARAESMVASKSFANRLFRLIQAKKRSTTQRRGWTAKPI